MRLRLIEPPESLKGLITGLIAVVPAKWRGEPRLIVLAGFREGGRAYIAPPVPSPYCVFSFDRAEEELMRHVLKAVGLRAYSWCRVSRTLLRPTVAETVKSISEELDLDLEADDAPTQY